MKPMNRRTLLQYSGMAAASLAIRPAFALSKTQPLAKTTAGRISGTVENGINVFRGIPYGADTFTTRFKAPKPPVPWSGVKECTTFTTRAPQLVSERNRPAPRAGAPAFRPQPEAGVESEDCLHLNVWSPGLRDHKKRPVIVYIHGGAYNNGSVNAPLYDGNRLCHRAEGDAVVVTVNHRLNAFGFLYLDSIAGPEYAGSGNVGMLDFVLALQWIRNNITEFGGDPNRVLIFGQSGGGGKCATMMALQQAHGLFHRVMTMSGQAVKGASIEIAAARTQLMLGKLGITKDNIADLKTIPMEKIQDAAHDTSSDWLPVVDGVVLMRDPFTPDAPPLSEMVPMILGNVHDETGVMARGEVTWDNAAEVLNNAVATYIVPLKADDIIAKYRQIYPDKSPIDIVSAAATAFRAWPGQVAEAERRSVNPKSQPHTWVYQMNFKGINGRAQHTIDIPFMFDNVSTVPQQLGTTPEQLAEAQPLATIMSGMLVQYAKTGNPNYKDIPFWPAYEMKERNTMFWDRTVSIAKDPRGDERRYAAYARYRQPGT